MAFKSLAELRREQQAAGLAPAGRVDGGDDDSSAQGGQFVPAPLAPQRVDHSPAGTISKAAGGYVRILPPDRTTIVEVTPEWREKFWGAPSPWCRIEGQPDHPEFEGNLKSFEDAK